MKLATFTVQAVVSLPTGSYGLYSASSGRRVWTKNFGYEPGDNVEVYYDETGPKKIIINGIEKPIT